MSVTDHFTTVSAMIEALRSDDPAQRLGSMKGLHLIAATLGPDRVRGELIPFLTDYLDENDEVLREFARALSMMIPEIGGITFVKEIITPLELLCGLEDVSVRDEAIKSMSDVGYIVFKEGTTQQQSEFTAMILNMVKSESPQTRCASAALVMVPYGFATPAVKTQLRQAFQKLCNDEEIMVRRGAVVALGERLAKVLETHYSDMLGVFTTLCKDTNDGIRLQCIPTAVAIIPFLQESGKAQIVQLFKTLSMDASWRVRFMAADKLHTIASSFSVHDLNKTAFPIFKSLCVDQEPEIRAAAVFNMNALVALSGDAAAKKDLVAAGTKLVNDTVSHVRMSLAATILKCVNAVGKDVWSTSIAPVCTKLLQDADAEVRLALVGGFSSLGGTAEGREVAPKLVPVIISLTKDPKWRVRETVVQQLPSLILNLNTSSQDVLEVCVAALNDHVATIREAACEACAQLLTESGLPWAKNTLFPLILPLAEQQSKNALPTSETEPSPHNYLRRVTFCHLLRALIPGLDNVTITSVFVPVLQQLSNDSTANVRINLARLLVLIKRARKNEREIDALLNKLAADQDSDVKDAVNMKG